MQNSDIARINSLLMNNKWLLNSVNAITSINPDHSNLSLADGFILVLRGLIRTSVRVQEIFGVKEATPDPNDPRFIRAIERILQENMDWIKPLVERYTVMDSHEDGSLSSSIGELFATAEECSSCDH